MYRDFFGLNHLPFKITPDLTFFYKHASREDIVHSIIYSLSRGDGIIKVVGEVGSGKTTLLRLIAKKLPKKVTKIFVTSPNLSPVDFLRSICSELNLPVEKDALKIEIVKTLQTYLIEQYNEGKSTVLLIDESQSMTIDTLEEVRLLGNLETETKKLLQIVLFGQPELDATLDDVRVKPLKDRISSSITIPHLNANEVMRYLNSRTQIAGYVGGNLFNLKISKRMHRITEGLPRRINLLADKLLMSAFADDSQEIKEKHFKLIGEGLPWYKKTSSQALVLLGLLAIVLFFVFMLPVILDQVRSIVNPNQGSKDNVQVEKAKVVEKKIEIKLDKKENEVIKTKVIDKKIIEESIVEHKIVNPVADEVLEQLTNWRKYWSGQQIESYLNMYGTSYAPYENFDRSIWEEDKTLRIKWVPSISINLQNIKVFELEQGLVETRFLQNYKSVKYSDSVRKSIIWKKENGVWKIFKETIVKK